MLDRTRLLWGTARRFVLAHFRPRYVSEQLRRRRRACLRCGRCCRILLRCPFLRNGDHCIIYKLRPKQCRMFPIDERDSLDVPGCAFSFVQSAADEGLAGRQSKGLVGPQAPS